MPKPPMVERTPGGLDPDKPWNQPGPLMRGMLFWPVGGTARQGIIDYLRIYHKIDASHLLDAPRREVIRSVDDVLAEEPPSRESRDEWLDERKESIRKATQDFLDKNRKEDQ